MKKEYIEPRISVVTCSSEQIMLLAGSPDTSNLNGGQTDGPTAGTEQEEAGSKFNSGMSWDEEE